MSGHTSFTVYVPFDESDIQTILYRDSSETLTVPDGKSGYFLLCHAQLTTNKTQTLIRMASTLILALLLLNAVILTICGGVPGDGSI